ESNCKNHWHSYARQSPSLNIDRLFSPPSTIRVGGSTIRYLLSRRAAQYESRTYHHRRRLLSMMNVSEQSKDQGRLNQQGAQELKEILKHPDKFVIRNCPIGWLAASGEIMRILGPLEDKGILELGCGNGRFSVFLAKQGAKVTGVDIGPDLIAAANAIAKINQVDCEFQTTNITSLPFESKTYDVVIGIAILHHLSKADVSKALSEAYRVLNKAG